MVVLLSHSPKLPHDQIYAYPDPIASALIRVQTEPVLAERQGACAESLRRLVVARDPGELHGECPWRILAARAQLDIAQGLGPQPGACLRMAALLGGQ
eukprot:1420327-Pyramimonas_sp.AAC.1